MSALGVDANLLFMLAVLLVLSALTYMRTGAEGLGAGLGSGAQTLLRFALIIGVSFLVAGLAQKLVPQQWVARALGDDAGLRAILLASAAGIVTPAGPFVSMPIAAVMIRSGAGTGAVVAFLASWSLLAVHRLVAWEVPILGWRFALMRYAACIVLPILAGYLARWFVR